MSKKASGEQPPQNEERSMVTNVVYALIFGALTFTGGSVASKHDIDKRIDEKTGSFKDDLHKLDTRIKGVQKDVCYIRAALAAQAGHNIPDCQRIGEE